MDSNNQKLEELLRQMYAQEEPAIDENQLEQTIDEEWEKFEAQHFKKKKDSFRPIWKIAAMFVGVLLLSGIAFAAVNIVRSTIEKDTQPQTEETKQADFKRQAGETAQQDSMPAKTVVFEDAELERILSDVATYYNYEVVYQNNDARHIRLYFTWNKQQGIDDIIETFNRFERIHVARENRKLIVK